MSEQAGERLNHLVSRAVTAHGTAAVILAAISEATLSLSRGPVVAYPIVRLCRRMKENESRGWRALAIVRRAALGPEEVTAIGLDAGAMWAVNAMCDLCEPQVESLEAIVRALLAVYKELDRRVGDPQPAAQPPRLPPAA